MNLSHGIDPPQQTKEGYRTCRIILIWALPPFFWRTKRTLDQPPHDIPARLPFAFSFINDLQLLTQKRNPIVLRWLERAYKEDSNVGYLQEGHALAESYGGEFIEFFRRATSLLFSKPPMSAADIGCGGVYLLQKVRELGLKVKGIDPSPITAAEGRRTGIEVISDFYPSQSLSEQFDILFHYDVLEHVVDPVAFLRAHHSNLSPNGALIFAVPDCSRYIALGDVSILSHEHLNYFDEDSLARVLRAAGFKTLLLEAAKHGGVLFCCAIPEPYMGTSDDNDKSDEKFQSFRKKALSALTKFNSLTSQLDCEELGLYVPLRCFPFLSYSSPNTKLRFFDDDPGLLGKYFDGFDIAIENFDSLLANPPAKIMICSLAFGNKIADRLRSSGIEDSRIFMWSNLF